MEQAFEWLFKDELLDGYILRLTLEQVAIAEALSVLCLVISILYNVVGTLVKTRGLQPIDFNEFGRIVVVMFAIGLYVPLVSFPVKVIDLINAATQPSTTEVLDYSHKLGTHTYEDGLPGTLERSFVPTPEAHEEDAASESMTLWQFLGMMLSPANAGAFMLDVLAVSLAAVVRVVMQALLKVLSLALFVFGPYAFVASILPIWRHKIVVWFNAFITIYFSYVVFNLLDRILYFNLFKDLYAGAHGYGYTGHQSLALNIALVILYVLPFWVSGKVVGGSDAGRFLSMFAQLSTSVSSAGLSKVGGFKQLARISQPRTPGTKDAMSTNR